MPEGPIALWVLLVQSGPGWAKKGGNAGIHSRPFVGRVCFLNRHLGTGMKSGAYWEGRC